jgi:arylsulfatase A-like enzyme
MLTGTWPHEQSTGWYAALDDRPPTVAEVLSGAGYRTGAMVANVFYTSAETGLGRGFSRYEDYPINPGTFFGSSSMLRTLMNADAVRFVVRSEELAGRKSAADINAAFLAWERRDRARPYFAFLNYYDAHTPYLPPEPWRDRFQTPGVVPVPSLERHARRDGGWSTGQLQGAVDAYDGAIGYLDAEITALLDSLAARGVLEQTLVIITSDHGEEFNEHGLIHHGNSLYRPSVSIPLVLRWPGHVPAGARITTPVSNRDIAATIVDLAGVTPDRPIPGHSLRRYWEGDTLPGDTLLSELRYAPQQPEWYPASKGNMISAIQGGMRYIRTGDGGESLFDFERDLQEQANLALVPERAGPLSTFRALIHELLEHP